MTNEHLAAFATLNSSNNNNNNNHNSRNNNGNGKPQKGPISPSNSSVKAIINNS